VANGAAEIPISVEFVVLAIVPIVVLLVLLIGFKWKGTEAGPVGMFAGLLIALFAFLMPWQGLSVAIATGIWDAIFILFVIWPALILYKVIDAAGGIVALRKAFTRFSCNELFLILAIGWVFSSFFQGISGFGTPIAVVAPLLVGLGVAPLYAVAIPLIGHAWAKMFGTLGVGWLATLQVVDLSNPLGTAILSAALLWIANLLGGLAIAWMYGRMAAIKNAFLMILVISSAHGGIQLGLMYFSPELSTFVASTVGLALLYPLSRLSRYSKSACEKIDSSIMKESDDEKVMTEAERLAEKKQEEKVTMSTRMSMLPYIILIVTALVVLIVPPIRDVLSQFSVGFSFPVVETGYGIVSEPGQPYSPWTPFTHAGFFLLVASVASWIVYRYRGFYGSKMQRNEKQKAESIWSGVLNSGLPASLPIIAFLTLAKIMDYSGQTPVLALSIATTAPPMVFAFASNWIGVLGAFITSSSTSSNILFSSLQAEAAQGLNLSQSAIIASQSAGGAIGNVIAPANAILGTGTAGIVGKEGEVLRKTLPWLIGTAIVTSAATIIAILIIGG
jgi:lactate permease